MTATTTKRKAEFAKLYRSELPAIVNYAARRSTATDAVDVAAETFAIAWRRMDDIPAGNERPWLYGVARRVLANQRRGTLRRTALHDKLCSEWKPSVAQIAESMTQSPLAQALNLLSDDDRDILLLAGVEELRPAEIALVLDVKPEVARNRLSRARARLRIALENTALHTTQTNALTEGGES